MIMIEVLDAKLYRVFFLIFSILYKNKELLYFALLWTASHRAFINLLLCQFDAFSVVIAYFLPREII
jgi:hypothetical protein